MGRVVHDGLLSWVSWQEAVAVEHHRMMMMMRAFDLAAGFLDHLDFWNDLIMAADMKKKS
jgi:hypothetical protein